jgi:ATP-dependent Lon protease
MIRNPKTLGSVFAIYGEAGTGKTTLIKDGLSHVFGLPFIFISLGGAQDRATLTGSNYVYEGSSCGKIIQSLKQSQCMNPIFYFDELDKTSGTEKGNEIINLLIHLTDYTQNSHFMDDYMDGIAIDLSRATFIFSFNNKNKVSPILLDRMEIIKFKSYSNEEKMVIARNFLLPSVVKNVFNDSSIKFVISDANMSKIVCNGSFVKKIFNRKYLKLGKIMKNVSRRKKENKSSCNSNSNSSGNSNGGVRYIKKILERIVSRINLQDLEKAAFRKSRTKTLERLKPLSKVIKKSFLEKDNVLTIDEKIINEVISNK